MTHPFKLGVVIVHFGPVEATLDCLLSLGTEANLIAYVVDNSVQSGHALRSGMLAMGRMGKVIETGGNVGFAAGFNAGLIVALNDGCEAVAVLNNDAQAKLDLYAKLLWARGHFPGAVWAGYVEKAKTRKADHNVGRIDPVWGLSKIDFSGPDAPHEDLDFVAGCFFAASKEIWQKVRGFDPGFFMYCEDLDFCLRLKKARIRIQWVPGIHIEHQVSLNTDRVGVPKEYLRMRNQWIAIMRHGSWLQKCGFGLRAFKAAYISRHRAEVKSQLRAGIRDGMRRKLGAPPPEFGWVP